MLETSQNSAYKAYLEIMEMLLENGVNREHCNYGLCFTDVGGLLTRNKNKIDDEQFAEFLELLKAINNYLGVTQMEAELEGNPEEARDRNVLAVGRTKALYVENAKDVTRGSLIAAFYYYYNTVHEGDDIDGSISFKEFFDDFKEEVDYYLDLAHYNKFSGRDLFDVMTAFSSYAYVYI